jgi:translation initiation factor IF-3
LTGVFKFTEAIKLADQFELDLVEISPMQPPVCKIMDYKKFVYEQKRDKTKSEIHTSSG